MKTKSPPRSVSAEPLEDDIRAYAYHLYEQNGCLPGHDLDNWLEAKACILANIPRQETHNRLRHHLATAGR
jgi:hypothetical protein